MCWIRMNSRPSSGLNLINDQLYTIANILMMNEDVNTNNSSNNNSNTVEANDE